MRGFWRAVSHLASVTGRSRYAYLRGLLASLSLREGGGGDLLARLGGLSLRKEDISEVFKPNGLL